MDQHGVDYSRITLSFSITTITTIFQMVLLLRSPEGMQHTGRLHLTVMTCPTIMSFITFRLMPLIPSCKLIIIHPLFGLSTWIAVVASYIGMITSITFGWIAVVACYINMITSITFGWIAVVASYIYMITSITFGWIAVVASYNNNNNNNNNYRNGSFLRGWLPHRGKAQMACNYCFPTRTMF